MWRGAGNPRWVTQFSRVQHTLDLSSVAGSTFFHRTLATRYLIERQIEGFQVAGEYQLLRRKAPFPIDGLVRAMRKLPDGLAWKRGPHGYVDVELIEQEAAAKARAELEKCLKAAEYTGQKLDQDGCARSHHPAKLGEPSYWQWS